MGLTSDKNLIEKTINQIKIASQQQTVEAQTPRRNYNLAGKTPGKRVRNTRGINVLEYRLTKACFMFKSVFP